MKNPYYDWWKVYKYWKIPKIHLAHIGKITWWYGLPISDKYYNKRFDIKISSLGKKDKMGSPRFEYNPYLCFTLFRTWQLIFIWNFVPYFKKDKNYDYELASELTWETIVWMTEYDKNLSEAIKCAGFWEYDSKKVTQIINLTRYGLDQHTRYLDEETIY